MKYTGVLTQVYWFGKILTLELKPIVTLLYMYKEIWTRWTTETINYLFYFALEYKCSSTITCSVFYDSFTWFRFYETRTRYAKAVDNYPEIVLMQQDSMPLGLLFEWEQRRFYCPINTLFLWSRIDSSLYPRLNIP